MAGRGKGKAVIGIVVGAVVVVGLVFGILAITRNFGKSEREVSKESATSSLSHMVERIAPDTAQPVRSSVEYVEEDETNADELPELDTNKITAPASTALYAEIWCSPEKAGEGTDGWMRELAEQFNRAGYSVGGQAVSVQIRSVSSGLAVDYMTTGKARADAISPSNSMWVGFLEAKGVKVDVVRDRTVGNVAGALLNQEHYDQLVSKYGQADLKAITEAVGAGELTMGYTNPFTSSTGLNFLVSTLLRYDRNDPLSAQAAEGFSKFQANVPFVALTTVQMRDAAARGSLDGFVTEHQLYANDPSLSRAYKFIPFGYRHDNPLVAFATTGEQQREIVELFAQYCDDHGSELAERYGFNGMDSYVSELPEVDGATLVAAQKLYKQNKDTGRPVVAVFVADVSGSMDGSPMHALQESLINSMRYIKPENYVGLVSYSDYVTINVPVAPFDLAQQSLFKGAVESLRAAGGTATYDAITVGLSLVQKQLEQTPDAKPMVFVLSDGYANTGVYDSLDQITDVVRGLKVPIYTIGYNADIDALRSISSLNEAAAIDASTDDVTYQLKNLFNANM